MAIEIHREPLYRRYYASVCSFAFFFCIIVWFLVIFLPLIIAYNTSEFWLKDTIHYIQPVVTYKYQTILEFVGERSGKPMTLYYSTSPTINQLNEQILRLSKLSSIEIDSNNDNILDRLELNVLLPLSNDESIFGVRGVIHSQVEILSYARYIFDSAAYINYDSCNPISSLYLDGDLFLRQTWPLTTIGGFKYPYENDPLISLSGGISAKDVSISEIMKRNNARNFTLVFNPNFEYSQRAMSSSGENDKYINFFNTTIVMRVPMQSIRFTPPVSQVLKNAWIQYVAYLVVVVFLLMKVNSFVFRHQLLHVYPVADIVVEKID